MNPDEPPPPPDNGEKSWLGSVRSWIGGAAADQGTQAPGQALASDTENTAHHSMSADEIRRKRLDRLLATQQQAEQPQAEVQASPVTSNVMPTAPESAKVRASGVVVDPMVIAAPNPKMAATPPPPPLQLNTIPKNPIGMDVSPMEVTPKPSSARNLLTAEQRASAALKRIFRVTLSSKDADVYTYMGDVAGEQSPGNNTASGTEQLLDMDVLQEIICSRLGLNDPKEGGGLQYLARCYPRCLEEIQTAQRKAGKGDDQAALVKVLQDALALLLNYSASSLIEPGIFEEAEEGPVTLVKMLTADIGSNNALSPGYLTAVIKALEEQDQLTSVVTGVFQTLLETISEHRSALSLEWLPSLRAITQLCSHKPAAATFVKLKGFFLPKEGSPEALAPAPTMHMLFHQPVPAPRSGLAVENTILGKVLRIGVGVPPNDSAVSQAFHGVARRDRRDIDNTVSSMQSQLQVAQSSACDLITQLLKAGPEPRQAVVAWMSEALQLNSGAEGSRPDPLKVASESFLINLSVVLLKLSMPFVTDPEKFAKVDAMSLLMNPAARAGCFPTGTTPLLAQREGTTEPQISVSTGATELSKLKSFVTQCFFLAWRAQHLSTIQMYLRHGNLHRSISHWQNQSRTAPPGQARQQAEANFELTLSIKFGSEITLCQPEVLSDILAFQLVAVKWLTETICQASSAPLDSSEHDTPLDLDTLNPTSVLYALPEHLVEDVLELLNLIVKYSPQTLQRFAMSLEPLMTFIVYLLAHPSLVRSPHLRAQLGDVLFDVFLPSSDHPYAEQRRPGRVAHEPHCGLLYAHHLAQNHLAPSLLLLYGDVEHTGFYEKLEHRYRIACVLKYLWKSPEHRSTFQRISKDTQQFVRFANGLMNETNSSVAAVMEKLAEIRTTQEMQRDTAGWGALTEERRTELEERFAAAEREVKSHLSLCNETLYMLSYLTSDPLIQKPFLQEELLPRLANMLLSVLNQLVGAKGLEIKVDNPESYSFHPKEMLRDTISVVAHFATGDATGFDDALATSGFYQEALLPKAAQTARRLGLLDPIGLSAVDNLCEKVKLAAERATAMDVDLGEIPDEFLDAIMFTIMKDPVLLPTSGNIVDRSTITQIILNDASDPFNRKPLTVDMLQPDHDLKAKIEAFMAQKMGGRG